MDKYIWYLIALPIIWVTITITYELGKLSILWLSLKKEELKRRFQ